MAHQPEDAVGHEAYQQLGAFHLVISPEALPHVVQQRRCPQLRVSRATPGVLVHLERVVEGIPLGMPPAFLLDPVESP